jgi:ADP-ribosyl-[dinitrogen reductase] hydrolase
MLGGLWGAVVGDALGVPVEFNSRAEVRSNPVTGMRGYGTHHQPPGTWSDDSSLLLCTTESLVHRQFDIEDIGQRFIAWFNDGLWAAHGDVFDVGLTTTDALMRIANGTPAQEAGGQDEHTNGNGSLMRILPVALRFAKGPIAELLDRSSRASAITHAHPRSQLACCFYALVVRQLLSGAEPKQAVQEVGASFGSHFPGNPELRHFRHLIDEDLSTKPDERIVSSGYVIDTLTASLWCLLTTTNFKECVLKAVNLGGDTDTTGCVAGGLAGVTYGAESIPGEWIEQLPRERDIGHLFNQFAVLVNDD